MNKNNFDFIRFVFAFVVMWEHIIALAQNSSIMYMESFFDSYSSVTGFFIISGFLITKSYKTTTIRTDYWVKRAKRLLPAYLLSIFTCAILLAFVSTYKVSQYFTDRQLYTYLLANLTFLNFIQPNLPGVFSTNPHTAVNGALWTLKVEVLFYISLPLVLCFVDSSKRKILILIVIYLLSIIYKTMLGEVPESLLGFLSRQTPGFYSYFIVGASFYYFFDFYYKNSKKLMLLVTPVFVFEYYYDINILRPFCFAVIIFYVAYNFPMFNKFGKYGDFSYGIYIYHWPIIQLFVYYGYFNLYNPYMICVVLNLIVISIAILSWNFVEKPFLRRKISNTQSFSLQIDNFKK